MNGVHVPACLSLDAHLDAAIAETAGTHQSLEAFVDEVRHTWSTERRIADAGDEAVIAYWRAAEADFMLAMGVSL